MGKRWRSRSICLRILWIASAIQGGTPDAHDLSSIALLRLLCPDSGCSAIEVVTIAYDVSCRESPRPDGGTAPSPDTDDELPDEVGVPSGYGGSLPLRPRRGGSRCHAVVPSGQGERVVPSVHLRSSRPHDILGWDDNPIHSLCRLTC
jgi:hypothetical protein